MTHAALSLRRATAEDADAVRALSRAAYRQWVPLIGREPLPMSADYARAVIDHVIDLWEEDGIIVALIEVIPFDDHLLIENIAVHPDHQGQGLGKITLRHAERLATGFGLTEIRLYTNAKFTSNLAFYERNGYREFKRGEMVPGSMTVHLSKWLTETSG